MTSRNSPRRGGSGGGAVAVGSVSASQVALNHFSDITDDDVQAGLETIRGLIPDTSGFVTTTGGGKEVYTTLSATSGSVTVPIGAGNYVYGTLTGNVTSSSVTGVTDGVVCSFMLELTAGSNTFAWWSGITWVGLNSAPTLSTSGTDLFSFVTRDNGTTWYGFYLTGSAPTQSKDYSISGALSTSTGALRLYNNSGKTRTITVVRATVGTAPTGASILVDVNKNGTTIFTTQSKRPTIAVSTNTDLSDTPDVTSWADGDYLTIDVDQIGSSVAGSNLVVQVVYTDG